MFDIFFRTVLRTGSPNDTATPNSIELPPDTCSLPMAENQDTASTTQEDQTTEEKTPTPQQDEESQETATDAWSHLAKVLSSKHALSQEDIDTVHDLYSGTQLDHAHLMTALYPTPLHTQYPAQDYYYIGESFSPGDLLRFIRRAHNDYEQHTQRDDKQPGFIAVYLGNNQFIPFAPPNGPSEVHSLSLYLYSSWEKDYNRSGFHIIPITTQQVAHRIHTIIHRGLPQEILHNLRAYIDERRAYPTPFYYPYLSYFFRRKQACRSRDCKLAAAYKLLGRGCLFTRDEIHALCHGTLASKVGKKITSSLYQALNTHKQVREFEICYDTSSTTITCNPIASSTTLSQRLNQRNP